MDLPNQSKFRLTSELATIENVRETIQITSNKEELQRLLRSNPLYIEFVSYDDGSGDLKVFELLENTLLNQISGKSFTYPEFKNAISTVICNSNNSILFQGERLLISQLHVNALLVSETGDHKDAFARFLFNFLKNINTVSE